MSAQSIANDILSNIKRIYQREEDKARELEDAKRQQKGNKIDKEENDFIKGLGALEKNMSDLLGEMQSRKKGSPKDFMRHIEIVEQCLASIQSILKKPLKFKVNKDIQELIHSTEDTLIGIRKSLPRITDTKCLCFGAEGS